MKFVKFVPMFLIAFTLSAAPFAKAEDAAKPATVDTSKVEKTDAVKTDAKPGKKMKKKDCKTCSKGKDCKDCDEGKTCKDCEKGSECKHCKKKNKKKKSCSHCKEEAAEAKHDEHGHDQHPADAHEAPAKANK